MIYRSEAMTLSLSSCWNRGFLALLLLIFSEPALASGQEVAYVLSVQGHWYARERPQADLHPGQGLRAGEHIGRRRPFASSDSLVVLDRQGAEIGRRTCLREADCNSPLLVPKGSSGVADLGSRLLQEVMALWQEDDARFTNLIGRGAADTLYEGVVALSNGKAELLPVVGDLTPGTYTLVWTTVGASAGSARDHHSIPLERRPGQPTSVDLGLSPGLYDVQAYRGKEPAGDPVADAWVLVVDEASYATVAARFDSAVAVAKPWAAEVSGDTIRRFLRTSLFALSRTPPG
jgi:hypothetical protein